MPSWHKRIMMTPDQNKYVVRFPEGLRDRIKEEAERNCRSMNAEIVFHLQNAIQTKKADAQAS